jgi:hypothetical protein
VALDLQPLDQAVLELETGVIGADMDVHGYSWDEGGIEAPVRTG